MRADHRVVITGIGSVNCLGAGGGAATAAALGRGVSGIDRIRAFPTEASGSHLAGEVADLREHLQPDESRRLSRASQLALVACRLALADAAVARGALPGLGLVLGSEYGDFRSSEEFARGYLQRGPLGLSPVVFPHTVMNTMAAHAAIAVGAQGPMLTLNQAGIAGELAVARAATLVAAGRAPAVLAGGVDDLCPILHRELWRLGAMSPRDGGAEGCWPFDRRANGTVLGEGATVVLLEAEAAARARGARVYAALSGASWGNLPAQRHGFAAPGRRDPRVICRALASAGVAPDDVGAAYLGGTGDPVQDACELDLIAAVFRTPGNGHGAAPALTTLTPLIGEHAGLGVLRVAAAAMTPGTGRIPGIPDLQTPMREGLAFARDADSAVASGRAVLVHGLGRGGGHAALVLTRAAS